jgi:ribokinase
VLLLQLEVPLEAVVAAARLARQYGVTVILDPAPALDLPAELYTLTDIITPNEVEAGQLVGVAVDSPDKAKRAARMLLSLGVKTAIIKLGAVGVIYAQADSEPVFTPAFSVEAVDTVAAGDAFNGGLAAALVEGRPLAEAVRWGAAAGALSVTKAGAQPSMPGRTEFEAFLRAWPD